MRQTLACLIALVSLTAIVRLFPSPLALAGVLGLFIACLVGQPIRYPDVLSETWQREQYAASCRPEFHGVSWRKPFNQFDARGSKVTACPGRRAQ